jgi:2,3-bisphosphoglycerate-independent phosphoglycerate mutase
MQDLFAGEAISADFTAEGWRSALGITDTPLLTHFQAGQRLAGLAQRSDLTIFEFWLSDVAGHHQDMQAACRLLEAIDEVLGALMSSWDDQGLILITSDHGNLEDLSTRHHTRNAIPLLLIGPRELREQFTRLMQAAMPPPVRQDLTAVAPAILKFIGSNESS